MNTSTATTLVNTTVRIKLRISRTQRKGFLTQIPKNMFLWVSEFYKSRNNGRKSQFPPSKRPNPTKKRSEQMQKL